MKITIERNGDYGLKITMPDGWTWTTGLLHADVDRDPAEALRRALIDYHHRMGHIWEPRGEYAHGR